MNTENTEDIGIVTAINGTKITVEISKGGVCKSCAKHGMCGIDSTPVVLEFDTNDVYQIGDKVRITIATRFKLLSMLIVYVLPLIALFLFYIVARQYMKEIWAIMAGFCGVVLSYLIIRILDKNLGKHMSFQLGGKYEDLP